MAEAIEIKSFRLLPPPPGTCHHCAVKHAEGAPHNAQSLYYQTRFNMKHGRAPRWSDALAHCGERTVWNWVRELRLREVWTAADDAAMNENTAIAEPTLYVI